MSVHLGKNIHYNQLYLIVVTMELNIVRMNNEEVNFNIRDVMKHLFNLDYCLKIGVVYQLVEEGVSRHTSFTPFKHVVVNVIENLDEAKQDEKKDCLTWLEFGSMFR